MSTSTTTSGPAAGALDDLAPTRFVDAAGTRIRIRESGDPAAPPVLLLHGIGRSLEDWDPQHPRLADGYRVIAADLAGFGFSGRPPGRASLEVLADTAVAVLDAVGETRPAHLMGNSLGGAVALLASTRHPQRVASLVLADPAGFGRLVTPALRVLGVPLLGPWLLGHLDVAAVRRGERALFVDPALVTEERVALAVELGRRREHLDTFVEIATELGTVAGVRPGWRRALLADAAANPAPTLVVWGERDVILPAAQLRTAARQLPGVQTHVFGRTGHMPQIERPQEFATLVREWLPR
ncbi:alpha/beta fold hydrolase [Pseudonocardia phyllosphaerae]|uniref:alpha/beta fold hydrolase n=1 Tax=Pseudonocardia phyllosphaerae TaxID=3390502 RepID=UPI003978EB2E